MNVSAQRLRQAAVIKDRIESLQRQLAGLLATSGGANRIAARPQPKKSSSSKSRPSGGSQKGGHLSAAAKAKLRAIARARWKAVKAAGRKAL